MKVTVKVICKKCGEINLADVEVSGLGRKPLNIPVINVLHALQVDPSGYPLFEKTARKYAELYGSYFDRGLIRARLLNEAERQGITLLELGQNTKNK